MDNNRKMDLSIKCFEGLSPRDAQYAIQFFIKSLDRKLEQADAFATKVYETVIKEASTTFQIAQSFKSGSRFVVDMPDETKKAINKGLIKLVKENGKLRAQLRDANGHYGPKLDIKEEVFNQGIDPLEMANALQLKAIQEQLHQISDQIIMINSSVLDILQGQQNDRIALFYSGLSLYLEAQCINNPEMKNALIVQSIRALSDGAQQLSITMETDIEFLTTGQFNKHRGKKDETIKSRMESINKAFAFIHQATLVRAAIYCEQNEFLAMSSVLDEYSQFIARVIVNNANTLSQCDPTDDGTKTGLWQSRARLQLNTTEIKELLSSNRQQEYYLFIEDNGNEN